MSTVPNVYYDPSPSKTYGNMTDAKRKINEEFLDNKLEMFRIGGIWIWYDYGELYTIILDKGVRKYSAGQTQRDLLARIVTPQWLEAKFKLTSN